jgi:hypothetical protein
MNRPINILNKNNRMDIVDIIKPVAGTILSFFAWVVGSVSAVNEIHLQNMSFQVAILAGIITVIYTLCKIWEWIVSKKYKKQ